MGTLVEKKNFNFTLLKNFFFEVENENLGNQGHFAALKSTLNGTFSLFFLYADLYEACKNISMQKHFIKCFSKCTFQGRKLCQKSISMHLTAKLQKFMQIILSPKLKNEKMKISHT